MRNRVGREGRVPSVRYGSRLLLRLLLAAELDLAAAMSAYESENLECQF